MAERRKLIVVSNRGPVSYSRQDGERVARRGGGGLVTALRGLVSHHDVTWIASAITDEDRAASHETIEETARDGSTFRLRLVSHDEAAYDWFYNVISNPMLWFLQHYLWEPAYTPAVDHGLHHAWEQGYVRVNEGFAAAAGNFTDWTADYRGRRARVTASPISIDPEEFDELAESPEVLEAERELVERRPERLVVRVDRTDPSKNVVRGFRSFELYLEAHPEMHGRVTLLALLDPSRQDIPEYSEYLGAIQREARRVNDRFQTEGWVPIDLQIEDNFPRSVAAYKQFDVLFVNAIFDGLNLVAKEAPLVNTRDGVVVLSENAGVFEELGAWTVEVNPFDVAAQAEAIHEALQLPGDQRRSRLEAIRAHVREHDLARWLALQLEELDRASARVS